MPGHWNTVSVSSVKAISVADLQTADGDERKQSVAERMVQPHPQARRSLGARRAHIVGAELDRAWRRAPA